MQTESGCRATNYKLLYNYDVYKNTCIKLLMKIMFTLHARDDVVKHTLLLLTRLYIPGH